MGLLPAAQYPAEFTSAVQNVPAGQTTGIIRTVAGFHILKVVDRQQTTAVMTVPELHVRHILLAAPADDVAGRLAARSEAEAG